MSAANPPRRDSESGRLLGALEEGVLRVREGRVIEANTALRRMLGRGDLLGQPATELFVDAWGQTLSLLATTEIARVREAGGRLRSVSIRQVSDEIFVIIDRSRERALEEEVGRLSTPAQADPAAPLRDEVVAMIEHELSTAQTAVRGYLRMLLEDGTQELSPQQSERVREAMRVSDRSRELLSNLLAVARDERQSEPLEYKRVHLHDVIDAALRSVWPLLEDAGIRVELDLIAEDDRVRADASRLERVFSNLLINGVRHAPETRVLQVHTSVLQIDRPHICVAVRDQGAGIKADQVDRIFEPFIQGHGSCGVASGGVGLGLAICRKTVEMHGGSIEAVPDLGHGLFRVLLPLEEKD
jgi:signal transduction histidine kinase